MPDMIRDGSGKSNLAKVDDNNRLHIQGVTEDADWNATKNGRSYNVNTGVINLSDAVDTPILYLKNNEDADLHISAMAVGMGPSTGGSGGIPKITIVRNPTTGTIISSTPTDVDISQNRNFGSSKTLTVDAYKGATDDTMTDGDDYIITFQTANGRWFGTVDTVLPKGSSIGIKIDPQASNSSMDVYVALICHLDDPEDRD